jgi:type III protein arginine methyltransferase
MSDHNASTLFEHPAQLLEMARRLIADGHASQAAALAQSAMRYGDATGLLKIIGSEILTHKVPGFHKSMLRDSLRNRAYSDAIAARAPGRNVLDIGTGSGLLAMMAARAGARHVYACELDQRLAETARDIVAANDLADRITILPLHSAKLDRNRDLAGGVDLVISEIFSDDLLGEGVLPSLEDARQRLCLPDAIFLPSKAAIRIALVGAGPEGTTTRFDPIGMVEGYDLSLFNRHIFGRKRFRPASGELDQLSEPADLFAFDFDTTAAGVDQACLEINSFGGLVRGVAQWIWFETAPGHEYENSPTGASSSHWQLFFHAFDTPIETTPGQPIMIHGWRDEKNLLIWKNDASNG